MPRLPWVKRNHRQDSHVSKPSKQSTVTSHASEKTHGASASETEDAVSAPWKALFYFTTKKHIPSLVVGVVTAIISGASSPAQSFLIGKAFGLFTTYGAGGITAKDLLDKESKYVLYMVAVGVGSWLIRFVFFTSWLSFGELQAKSARDRLFCGLLHKDIAWYDRRKHGVGALSTRLQM